MAVTRPKNTVNEKINKEFILLMLLRNERFVQKTACELSSSPGLFQNLVILWKSNIWLMMRLVLLDQQNRLLVIYFFAISLRFQEKTDFQFNYVV